MQFLGQWFSAHFFELPGHGLSTAFRGGYSSHRAAQTVEDWINALGYDQITLMGFSFGGILALRTLARLQARVERVILFSPCVTHRALRYSAPRLWLIRLLSKLAGQSSVQAGVLALAHHAPTVGHLVRALGWAGKLDPNIHLRDKLLNLPMHTLRAVVQQVEDILSWDFKPPASPFRQPLLLGMSPYDPMLDLEVTQACLAKAFPESALVQFPFRFHQPPRPLTLAELNRNAGTQVAKWLNTGRAVPQLGEWIS